MPATTKIWTEAELLALPKDGFKRELVNGDIEMSPAGMFGHGDLITRLSARLTYFVLQKKLGVTGDGQTGFWMKSGNLRCPDISFVSKARAKKMKQQTPRGFPRGSPDLVVEVLSPSETATSVSAKIAEYFDNDTKLAWVIDPDKKTIAVYRSATSDKLLHSGDTLEGELIVPGFSISVDDVFAEPDLD